MAKSASGSVRRVAGRIVEWNDERGYGFVLPNGGGEKRFLHVKAFLSKTQRPAIGDAVAYAPGVDERGRPTAVDVTFNLARLAEAPAARRGRTTWRAVLGAAALGAVGLAWRAHALPSLLALAVVGASAASFVLYARDKGAAEANRRRTPEATLHLWALLGGWPGALVAQHVLRHKSRKASFQTVFWATVTLHGGALLWLVTSESGALLRAALESMNG
jgi:uncharacterized membrane protein YsdA (DUF1294 family)/cold shock CspA family protein